MGGLFLLVMFAIPRLSRYTPPMDSLKAHIRWYSLSGLFLVTIFIWSVIFSEGHLPSREGLLRIAFLDVGQGDAIFIETVSGRQVLIDGGPNGSVLAALGEVMPYYDRSIDLVVATHPDLDHIGGLPAVFERFKINTFLASGVEGKSAAYTALMRSVTTENVEHLLAQRGLLIHLDEETTLQVLFPDREFSDISPNDASVVLKLTYRETSFLFTGDSPKKIEKYLVFLDKENLDVDVLKVGHHGSKTSSEEVFVERTSPLFAVISVGAQNRYGHPHQEVLEVFERFGSEVLRTDKHGTIIIESDGREIFVHD